MIYVNELKTTAIVQETKQNHIVMYFENYIRLEFCIYMYIVNLYIQEQGKQIKI